MVSLSQIDEDSLRRDLLEQVPQIAFLCHDFPEKLGNVITTTLVPIVGRYLKEYADQVRKTSHAALLVLLKQDLISDDDVLNHIIPSVIFLTKPETLDGLKVEAVALMTEMVPLVCADASRMLVERYVALCSSALFEIRKVCAALMERICSVIGVAATETDLLPVFILMCEDAEWEVRKSCARVFFKISLSCSPEKRRQQLSPIFDSLLADPSNSVRMVAFQHLGAFISTFADPGNTGIHYENGALTVVEKNHADSSQSYSEDTLLDGKEADLPYMGIVSPDHSGRAAAAAAAAAAALQEPQENPFFNEWNYWKIPLPDFKIEDSIYPVEGDSALPIPDVEESLSSQQAQDDDHEVICEMLSRGDTALDWPSSNTVLFSRPFGDEKGYYDHRSAVEHPQSFIAENVAELPTHPSTVNECETRSTDDIDGSDDRTLENMTCELSNCTENNPNLESEDCIAKMEAQNITCSTKSDSECVELSVNDTSVVEFSSEHPAIESSIVAKCDTSETVPDCEQKMADLMDLIMKIPAESEEAVKCKETISNFMHLMTPFTEEEESAQLDSVHEKEFESSTNFTHLSETQTDEEECHQCEDEEKVHVQFPPARPPDVTDEDILREVRNSKSRRQYGSVQNCCEDDFKISNHPSEDALPRCSASSDNEVNMNEWLHFSSRDYLQFVTKRFYYFSDDNLSRHSKHTPPPKIQDDMQQPIVPKFLLDQYITMTDPNRTEYADRWSEVMIYCAYTLPGVAFTLGRQYWPMLKSTFDNLSTHMHWKIRRTLAFSIHELAFILGEELTEKDLLPVFEDMTKDLDEVRIGVVKHLSDFLKQLPQESRNIFLPRLVEFLKAENKLNWRFRHELTLQLSPLCELYSPEECFLHIWVLTLLILSNEKISSIKRSCCKVISQLCRKLMETDNDEYIDLMGERLFDSLANSESWGKRQSYVHVVGQIIEDRALPLPVFSLHFLDFFLDLSKDVVPNIRLAIARVCNNHLLPLSEEFRSHGLCEELLKVESVVNSLRDDPDRDVRHFAAADVLFERDDSPPTGGGAESPCWSRFDKIQPIEVIPPRCLPEINFF